MMKMMKKIVVLILVLGIASMASADLTWTTVGGADLASVDLNPGESVTVRVASDSATGGTVYTVSPDAAVALITGQSVLPAAGDDASILATYASQLWVKWESKDDAEPFNNAAGPWAEFTLSAPAGAAPGSWADISADIYASSAGRGTDDLLTVNIIPEPATLALLGLGGLLLRKRK